jgi:hypothetical protein
MVIRDVMKLMFDLLITDNRSIHLDPRVLRFADR